MAAMKAHSKPRTSGLPRPVARVSRKVLPVQCAAIKLHYFQAPARAEATRLLLLLGGIDYEFVGYDRQTWQQFKPMTPYGAVPVLEVDGKMLAQSSAIERYAAKLAGMYPSDPWTAALSDEWAANADDILQLFVPTFRMQDPEEKKKARQEIIATTFATKMKLMEARLGDKPFITGDKPVAGDIVIYVQLSNLVSGFFDGIPANLYESFPVIRAYRNRVASLDPIRKNYETQTELPRSAFRPDA